MTHIFIKTGVTEGQLYITRYMHIFVFLNNEDRYTVGMSRRKNIRQLTKGNSIRQIYGNLQYLLVRVHLLQILTRIENLRTHQNLASCSLCSYTEQKPLHKTKNKLFISKLLIQRVSFIVTHNHQDFMLQSLTKNINTQYHEKQALYLSYSCTLHENKYLETHNESFLFYISNTY